jgi:hypothetical protein
MDDAEEIEQAEHETDTDEEANGRGAGRVYEKIMTFDNESLI